MDGERFDGITRALVGTTPRRQLVRRVLGGLVGGAVLTLGTTTALEAQGDCGPCKTKAAGGRCEYVCDRACQVCDARNDACVARVPLPTGCP
jgi:hypothetical protein